MTNTKIEWTDATWNPVTGCTKITRGCDFCYAERFAERFRNVAGHPFEKGFDLTLRPERLKQPLQWRKSKMIFVNSMSDLFHKDIPWAFIDDVFDTMEKADWHVFQVLTKRSSLMRDYLKKRYGDKRGPQHIWCGVSVEDAQGVSRIEHLRQSLAGIRFLSIEPLIGSIGKIDLSGIDWVIVGGESGPGARPMHPQWARSIRDQCIADGIPFFFKQWGEWYHGSANYKKEKVILYDGRLVDFTKEALHAADRQAKVELPELICLTGKKRAGRLLDGQEWNQFPKVTG